MRHDICPECGDEPVFARCGECGLTPLHILHDKSVRETLDLIAGDMCAAEGAGPKDIAQ